MSRVRPEGIDQFHERLEAFKRSNKASLSIKDVVAKSMRKIEEARNYGATWDDVAKLLSESFQTDEQGGLQITGKTVQGYYSKILKERHKEKELSGQVGKQSKKGSATAKSKLTEKEPFDYQPAQLEQLEQSGHERMQGIIASSNGFNGQPKTEDLSLTESSAPKKSRFNFNTVRTDS